MCSQGEDEEVRCQDTCDSIVPGTQSVFVKTWGCAHNSSDGEYMAGQLAAYGYQIVGESKEIRTNFLFFSFPFFLSID